MATHLNKIQASKSRDAFWEIVKDFSSALASIPDLKSLSRMILETMVQMMHNQKASLFLLNEEKAGFHLVESIDLEIRTNLPSLLLKEDPLLQDVLKRGEILLRDGLARGNLTSESSEIIERMTLLEAAISIPLTSKGKLIGLINLSKKPLSESYSHEDVELLSTLANQSAVALENRRLSEDLKKSKSHIERADRLASLGTLTAALAHEVRNPLVAIKTFTQLLPERFDDEEFRNHFLHIVSGEGDRI